MFIATKRLEGRSEKTLFLYRFNIEKMLEKSDKNGCFKDSFCAQVCPMAPCSVKHGGLQYCFECPEYPCRHYDGFDSYDTLVLHRNQRKDMQKAKEMGIDAYLEEQREKKRILERLLEDYNDGQQDVFYCRAVNMLELEALGIFLFDEKLSVPQVVCVILIVIGIAGLKILGKE